MASSSAASWLDALLAVLYAPECASCRRLLVTPTAGPVCAQCWSEVVPLVPPLCHRCGDALPSWRVLGLAAGMCQHCGRHSGEIDRGCSAGVYEGALRKILHAFKYDGRTSLANPLASLMLDSAAELLSDAHCAVPVPLHPWRRMRRGFNQSAALARRLGIPVVHALWRTKMTAPQAGLSATARRRNVASGFTLSLWMRRASQRRKWLTGQCVVLVDDVWTTGATLNACAAVLKQAGVREVRAVTVARAAPPGHNKTT